MGIFKNIRRAVKNSFTWGENEQGWQTINISNGKNIERLITTSNTSEITYYICLKILSESIGKLSIHLKDGEGIKISDSDINYLLKVRPNPFMTPTDFKTLLES